MKTNPMITLTIADKESPERQITLTAEQAQKLRARVLERYAAEGSDDSKVSRRNPIWATAKSVVAQLDGANFWERELDDAEKYWSVVFLTRMLKGLKRRYANSQPAFVEIF